MNRAVVIASVLSILTLAALAADIFQYLLAVPPMPEEMKCAVRRNSLAVDPIPVPPLVPPRLSDTR
jgi:hypothetical protein